MKTLFATLIIILLTTPDGVSQCNAELLSKECIPKFAEGFNFLKSYKIEGSETKFKVEYSYVFTKGTQYMINICASAKPSEIIVTLYDSDRNKVATNKTEDKCMEAIAYSCNSTGIYYMTYTSNISASYCGASALGFKRLAVEQTSIK